jgi:hypothetical protein
MLGEKLAHALEEKGITVQGVNVKSNAKEAKLITPENLEIRFSKGANEEPFLSGLAETVKRFTGEQPKLVSVSNSSDLETTKFGFPRAEQPNSSAAARPGSASMAYAITPDRVLKCCFATTSRTRLSRSLTPFRASACKPFARALELSRLWRKGQRGLFALVRLVVD